MATTEPQTGHNIFRSTTEIRRDGDHFVVCGLKRITSGLDVAERVLVFGRAPKATEAQATSYTTILVDPRAPGAIMTELPMRHREGVKQYQLRLDDVRAPQEDLVGAEGQGLLVMWPFTHVERVLTAALCLGVTGYAITRSVQRAKDRVVSGTMPIGANQAIAHPLAALHARLEATRLFVYRTAARFDAEVDGFVTAGEANMAKLLAADLAFDSTDHAVQVLGAEAWDEREGWLDSYLDARLSRSGPVSNEFALNYVAQHVLGLPAHAS
jgi:alkylation response protein AidB-like acyl-CoA dehydrogenase